MFCKIKVSGSVPVYQKQSVNMSFQFGFRFGSTPCDETETFLAELPLFFFFFFFCIVFSIYPPDLQESDRGAMHREAITPTCFRRYRDIAVRLIFFTSVL